MPLNEVELQQLKSAISILSQFKGMPQFEWMHELLAKLEQGPQSPRTSRTIIEFDHNQYLKGIEHLGTLHNAIAHKKVLTILYRPYDCEAAFDVTLHPYYLKQYNNRWFLFGYNPETGRYDWNLALDRMLSVKEIKGSYKKNDVIAWSEYFEDIIGVTKPDNGRTEKIVLNVIGKTAKYIETKLLHGSQKGKWLDSNTMEVILELIVNKEFERLLLSYADSMKVIKPTSLKNRIRERLEIALAPAKS